MAQQPQRYLPLFRGLHRTGPEQRDAVLDVLVAGAGNELQHGAAAFLAGGQPHAAPYPPLTFIILPHEREQRLLRGGVETTRHRLAPTTA